MEQSDEILRLLAEIRDLQREHLAEYQRISEEVLQYNRAASEKASAQYKGAVAPVPRIMRQLRLPPGLYMLESPSGGTPSIASRIDTPPSRPH